MNDLLDKLCSISTIYPFDWWVIVLSYCNFGSFELFLDPSPGSFSFYRTQTYLGPDLCPSVRDVVADLTNVTLADKDTDSILTDNVNRAFQVKMPIWQSKAMWQCK